jgi:hypothetical protein
MLWPHSAHAATPDSAHGDRAPGTRRGFLVLAARARCARSNSAGSTSAPCLAASQPPSPSGSSPT